MARQTNAELLRQLEAERVENQHLRAQVSEVIELRADLKALRADHLETVNIMAEEIKRLRQNQAPQKPAVRRAVPNMADAARRYCAEHEVNGVSKPVLMAWIGGAK
jgi:hypothetical protein